MRRLAAAAAGALIGLAIMAGLLCVLARQADCALAELGLA